MYLDTHTSTRAAPDMSPQVVPSQFWIFDPFFLYIKSGAARGLLGSRHLVVKITDFTDLYPIWRGFQRYLKKLRRYFTAKRPKEPPLNKTSLLLK